MSGGERVIEGPECLEEGAQWLVRREPRFRPALEAGPLPLRLRGGGFGALAGAIVGQQVSRASAEAILARCELEGLLDPETVRGAPEAAMIRAGLSRPKQRYLRALAAADLDYADLRERPTSEVLARLKAVPGIGSWTAEIYAMFSLGRADVFAPGDLALQEAARVLFALEARPAEKVLRGMAEDWSPWRSVAARALWSYYGRIKGREGIR